MLIELYGKNFGCFRDEFRLSMLATDIDPDSDRGIVEVKVEGDDQPLRLLRAVALYGPNASGKSTVVRAATALSQMLRITGQLPSESPLQPYEPFALGVRMDAPVALGARAVINSVVYDYSVSFDRASVHHETLSRLSGGSPCVLFDRANETVVGEWRHDPRFELLTRAFRPNALILSLADTLTPELAETISVSFQRVLQSFDTTLEWSPDLNGRVAERVLADPAFGGWLLGRLKSADIGVVDLRPEEVRQLVRVRRPHKDSGPDDQRRAEFETAFRLTLLHGAGSGAAALPYRRESLGTRRLVELSPLLYDLTHDSRGITIFVDEFDASVHPLLLEDVVGHFNRHVPMQDVRGQLIFTTHETTLLDDEAKDSVLRRDQVYLTEKGPNGASRLFSVAEFKERNNLNIRRRYLQGRYGALPSLGTFTES